MNGKKLGFIKEIIVMVGGTAAVQIINIIATPIITRIYGPEIFGVQGIYLSVFGIFLVIVGLGYQFAIALPKKNITAKALTIICLIIGIITSTITAVLININGEKILKLFAITEIIPYRNDIAPTMVVGLIGVLLTQWLIRKNAFREMAVGGIASAVIIISTRLILAEYEISAKTLIWTSVITAPLSALIAYALIKRGNDKSRKKSSHFRINLLKIVAIRYRDFPCYRLPHEIINGLSHGIPFLLIAKYSDANNVGLYMMALAILGLPSNMISTAISTVYFNRVNKIINDKEEPKYLIIKMTIGMAYFSIIPFLIVIFYGPVLFEYLLGDKWKSAGIYAQIMTPYIFMQFINKPAVAAISSLKMQDNLLIYEIISTTLKTFGLIMAYEWYGSDYKAIGVYSSIGAISYALLIAWVILKSKQKVYGKTSIN
jgi:O-antigen/teichoic acid export membrane protein